MRVGDGARGGAGPHVRSVTDDLALLSAACRLPGADSPEEFWQRLTEGTDLTQEVPPDRFDVDAVYDTGGRPGTTTSRWGTFIRDPWAFDAAAFGLKPRKASAVDPQQRLLLTCAREALTAAGISPLGRTVGVFVGTTYATHTERVVDRWRAGLAVPMAGIVGNLDNMLAARVSHALDLKGPALAVDTACSSTLVALHLARRALQAGDCDLALVGGAHLLLSSTIHLMLGRSGALSPSGRCRPFSSDADGIVLGEGVGMFVVGRLEEAVRSRWPVMARIRGTAVGNDGQSLNPMAPRPGGQVATLETAWREAGLDPDTVDLIEAHGTGTPVGDPVEAQTLARVFGGRPKLLGSVKGNVGHLMGAAGVPALLKICWAFRHRAVPASLHCATPRADLALDAAGFRVPSVLEPWSGRLAGVNAFGFGGTNAHVILEAPEPSLAWPAAVTVIRGERLRLDEAPADSARLDHPVLTRIADRRLGRFEFEGVVAGALLDHVVGGAAILPGSAVLDLMLVAGEHAIGAPVQLEEVLLERPVTAGPIRVSVAEQVEVFDGRGRVAVARITRADTSTDGVPCVTPSLQDASVAHEVSPAEVYGALARAGMLHGPAFRRLQEIHVRPETVSALIGAAAPTRGTRLCPFALDAALQAVAAGLLGRADALLVPFAFERVRVWGRLAGRLRVEVSGLQFGGDEVRASVQVIGEDDVVLVQVDALRLRTFGSATNGDAKSRWVLDEAWRSAHAGALPSDWQGVVLECPRGAPDAVIEALVSMVNEAHGRPMRVVVRNAWRVVPDDPDPDPSMAAAAAYVAALVSEWSGGDVAAIDLAHGEPLSRARVAATGARLAWRDGWHEPGLVTADAPAASIPASGVWLITGGAGGLGLAFAQALAGCRCVLVGRSPLTADRAATVASIGAIYLQSDAATPAPIIAEVLRRFGRLDGVVHAAGEARPRRLGESTRDDRCATLRGKLGGAIALADAVDAHRLDPAVLLISSAAAVEPVLLGSGLADYAAANAGLLALAARRRAQGHNWSAVAYGPIADVGLAAAGGVLDRLADRGWHALPAAAAVRAGLRVLASGAAWRIVADHRAPEAQSLPDPLTDLPAFLQALVGRALKLPAAQVPRDVPFSVLGLDSLDAVELARALDRAGFGPVSDALFFELRTVDALAAHLAVRRAGAPSVGVREAIATEVEAPPARSRIERAFLLQSALFPAAPPFAWLRQTLRTPLDPHRLQAAVERLVRHHHALHTGFRDGEPFVAVHIPSVLHYTVSDDAALARLGDALASAPFDLAAPPLFRVALVRQHALTHLVLVAHHAVVDGWSLALLARNLWTLYADTGATLSPDATAPADAPDGTGDSTPVAPWPRLPGTGGLDGPRTAAVRWLDATQTAALLARAARLDATPFALIAASVARALGTWVGATSVTINVAVARRSPATADAVGCFAETVPLTLPADRDVAETVALATQRFERARRGPAGTAGQAPDGGLPVPSPFSLSVATFQGTPPAGVELVESVARSATAATRIGLTVWRSGDRLGLAVNTPATLLEDSARDALADVLADALRNAGTDEFHWCVDDVLRMCRDHATAPAVVQGLDTLTYRDLETASGRFAAGLDARGIGPGTIVAVVTEPGPSALIALLGVLRAGATWMPIDPSAPPLRTERMLRIAAPALVVDDIDAILHDGAVPDRRPAPDDPAYVMFTSGSTGEPKGVPISARSISAYLRWAVGMLEIAPGDRLLATSAIGFDASIRQLLAPLMVGAAVHPVTGEQRRDPHALCGRMACERITHLNTSPAQLARILAASGDSLPQLRHVTVGGEALAASLASAWQARFPVTLVNLYGPTETTISATYHIVQPGDDPVPIGRPQPGWRATVIDGELCIGGDGLTSGYLGGVATPFVTLPDGTRAYRTGDRVRYRADGALVYVGRIDAQLQIRGVRVEPGEVEAAMMSHDGVRLAAVAGRGSGDQAWLEAWFEGDETLDDETLRAHLTARVPDVMVPRRIHRVSALPLGATGKVDRARLGDMCPVARIARGGPPANAHEAQVAAAWQSHLHVTEVGRDDDFFALGGDSVLAVSVSVAVGAPAAMLYRHPVLREYAAAVATLAPSVVSSAGPSLSAAQVGFLRAELHDPLRPAIWKMRCQLDASLSEAGLCAAWDMLLRRHPLLRARFDGRRMRIVETGPSLGIDALPAQLNDGPLLLGRLSPGTSGWLLEVMGHHLIGDGWSAAVLLRELLTLHDDPQAPLPTPAPWSAVVSAQARPVSAADQDWWRAQYAAPVADPGDAGLSGPTQVARRTVPRRGVESVLHALHMVLASRTGQDDLVIAVARSGRDLPVPGVETVVGPLAVVMPVRMNGSVCLREWLAHAVSPAALSGIIPGFAGRFVLTYLDFPVPRDSRVQAMESEMSLPAGTVLQLAVRVDGECMELVATGGPAVEQLLDTVADTLLEPLPVHDDAASSSRVVRHAQQGNEMHCDAALIAYLPPRSTVLQAVVLGAPLGRQWIGSADTPFGRLAVLALPRFGNEVLDVTALEVAEAVRQCRAAGARVVALAGLLPARTDYGHAVASLLSADDASCLTTGHAVTSVAVVMTTQALLTRLALDIRQLRIGVLGAGSVGRAALRLVCDMFGAPREAVICDLAGREALVTEFGAGLPMPVHFAAAEPAAPRALYDCDLIIGASSAGDTLDVERLRPGCVVVDDSFPSCFSLRAAIARMEARRDVLLVGGGRLDLGARLEPVPMLRPFAPALAGLLPPDGLPGCAAEAVLCLAGLAPATGLVHAARARSAWSAAEAAGARAATLHLGGMVIQEALLDAVGRVRRG